MTTQKKQESAELRYTKEAFAASRKYANFRDLIGALLVDNKDYTVAEVDKLIENYQKGEVQ